MATASTARTDQGQNTIVTYVTDMHSLVSHGIQAIRRQVDNLKDKNHPQALSAIQDFQRTLEGLLNSLEARARALGGSTTHPVKEAVSALSGIAAGVINAFRPEEAAKSLRDDYTFFSLVNVGFLMLHTTSMSLGDQETAGIAERGYRESARMVMQIDRIIPQLVLEELRQDGLQVKDVSSQCQEMVRRAWDREASVAGMKS